jgi:hypothetical protein
MTVLRSTTLFLCACLTTANAPAQKSSAPKAPPLPHLTAQTRGDIIRAFNAELVFIRTPFPMGKTGLTLKDGVISPSGAELDRLMTLWGPAVKPGDEVRLTNILIKGDRIHFEINGGPVKKTKWYEHVQVSVGSGTTGVAPHDQNANPRGSYVDLVFDHYVPELTPQQLKALVRPVFDFDAKSVLEAYLDTVPPKVKEAIKNHQVLVGMNREMLMYAKGRPPRKIREKDGETDYEEWIYGEPPQDVDFVRIVDDQVVRLETMKVDGTKVLRTEKEVDIEPHPDATKASDIERTATAPSLRRPGEAAAAPPTPTGNTRPATVGLPPASDPGGPGPGQAPPPPPSSGPGGPPQFSS